MPRGLLARKSPSVLNLSSLSQRDRRRISADSPSETTAIAAPRAWSHRISDGASCRPRIQSCSGHPLCGPSRAHDRQLPSSTWYEGGCCSGLGVLMCFERWHPHGTAAGLLGIGRAVWSMVRG
ncbi:hypothetical protein LIA77_06322 [Sarocladium implicatum]|nr:hypothetical protein LIA77_06322 [Sarocladium implicatum]